jgi:hypothetical protein
VLAATALGFGAVWKSAAVLEATPIRALFDLAPRERLLGWINVGTPGAPGRKKQSDGGADDGGPLVTTLDSARRGPG